MFMYLNPDDTYARTQAEAQKGAKRVDVPTDAKGLVAHLNLLVETHKGDRAAQSPPEPAQERQEIVVDVSPHEAFQLAQRRSSEAPAALTVPAITDFILDEATVAQVEHLMGCLGTRVAEMAKELRKAA